MSELNEELNEFFLEARELLDAAEENLLNFDDGQGFNLHYDAIFRALHNLKGSAGIFEQLVLQEHVHTIETAFTQQKDAGSLSPELIDYFLKGCDHARKIIDDPNTPHFSLSAPDKTEVVAAEPSTEKPQADVRDIKTSKPAPTKPLVTAIHSGDSLKAAVALLFRYYPEMDTQLASQGRHDEREVLRFELQALLNSIKKSA